MTRIYLMNCCVRLSENISLAEDGMPLTEKHIKDYVRD